MPAWNPDEKPHRGVTDCHMWSQELAQVADGRIFALLGLGGPVIAWVLFNILGPAQRQIDNMAEKQADPKKRR